ncbi:TonB-dependent receptor [Desulfosoma sp.]|uniref:TonB-dependent receptor n=1 Tax=Desulfosoma sp. TaxID=2603217 RepID=UPI00404B6D21
MKTRPLLTCLLVLFLPPLAIGAQESTLPHNDKGDTIVLTAEEIRAMKALKMPDVLNHVPGVKAGDSSVSIHGSLKVKVFVDGRPINDPTSTHGGVNWDLVFPDEVERIEILRGKGGLAYGQDASGGIILITTRRKRQVSGKVKTYAGNFGTHSVNASTGISFGKVSGGVNGGYEGTDGYHVNNDKKRWQTGIKVDYAPHESTNGFGFSADMLHDERGLPGQPKYSTPFSRKESRNAALALRAELWRWTTQTAYNEGYTHNTDKSMGLDRTLRVSKIGQDLSTTFKTSKRGHLICGAAFSWDRAEGDSFDDQQEYGASLFAAQTLAWPEVSTTLTAGLRGNYHSVFDNTLNPEIKAVYKKPTWRLTGSYSRTQNIPSFYQRYNETSSTRPNPNLTMEKADNFSLAFSATPHKAFSFSLTGFFNLLSDRITYVTGGKGIGWYQNFGKVIYVGWDGAFSLKMTETLEFKGAYTYLEAKDKDTGLWIPGKARHTSNLTLLWHPFSPLSLVAVGTYSSTVYRNKANTKTVPGYVIADLRAEYAFKRWSLFTEVKNIFDKTYYYADGLLAPPLTWLVGLEWKI